MYPFPPGEYQQRIDKTRASMSERGIDILLSTNPANMGYLTGYDGWSFYVHQLIVLSQDAAQPLWIGRGMDANAAKVTTYLDHDNILGYPDDYVQSTIKHPMNFVEMNPVDAKARGFQNGDIVAMENDEVYVQKGGFYRARHKDFLFTNLEKDGYIYKTQGSTSAMVYVTSVVPPGTTFMYFMWPGGGASNALSSAVADPLTNAPRYKLGKAVFRKIGSIPDHLKARMTFKEKA
jgi:hypothetical protein